MQDEGQRDRTPGEAVYGMPVAGAKRIRTALAAVGILDLPGLSEAGTDPGSLPGDPGQETRMRREKLDDYYRTGKKGNQMSRLWKWGAHDPADRAGDVCPVDPDHGGGSPLSAAGRTDRIDKEE